MVAFDQKHFSLEEVLQSDLHDSRVQSAGDLPKSAAVESCCQFADIHTEAVCDVERFIRARFVRNRTSCGACVALRYSHLDARQDGPALISHGSRDLSRRLSPD